MTPAEMVRQKRRWVACLMCALAMSATAARASETDRQSAQALFDRGRVLLEQGRYAEACPLFAESQKLDPGGGTLLNLALCREKEGRLATAHALYNDALSTAIRDRRDDRRKLAEERIAALAARLPRLRFELPPNVSVSALRLELDGAALPPPVWTSSLPVDPGAHRVRVHAAGYEPQTRTFRATEGRETLVRFHALARRLPPPPPETRFSTASWIVGGAGLAVLGAAAVTGVIALSADAEAADAVERADCMPSRDFCRDPAALEEARRESDRARSFAWISTGALIVGSGALVTAWLLPRETFTISAGREHVSVQFGTTLPAAF